MFTPATSQRLSCALLISLLAACSNTGEPTLAQQVPSPKAEAQQKRAEAEQTTPAAKIATPAAPGKAIGKTSSVADQRVRELAAPSASMPAELRRMPPPMPTFIAEESRERYQNSGHNPIQQVALAPVSTFSIDVDTGSYSNVRRILKAGQLPPSDAVRVEELINYFPYDYAQPQDGRPFAVHTELAPAPWNANRVLLRVGIKGQDVAKTSLPPANLVFLVDVSGSMMEANKLPLLKSSLKLLVNEMREQDRISLVTYASGTRIILPPTSGRDKAQIVAAIDGLSAGGSTAGAAGISLAYSAAEQAFIKGGINRILLATDGDFNVGISSDAALKNLVTEKRKSGISLSTLGFGTGNYNEAMMEQIADVGDGSYAYIDSLMEGHKVLVNEMTSTLSTIANDVKVQLEFNPAVVSEYRQIGYENRQLAPEDINNDKIDAGDIGAGHSVTALYELTLVGSPASIDPLRYATSKKSAATPAEELGFLRLRYKPSHRAKSLLIERPIARHAILPMAQTSSEFRFASAVAGFGQVLRGGQYTGNWGYTEARELAQNSRGTDRFGYRAEFLSLLDLAQALSPQTLPLARH